MSKYRAAIIGCGLAGGFVDDKIKGRHTTQLLPYSHAGAYMDVPEVELVAGADTSETQLRAFSKKWGVKALYTDYNEMLKKEQIDIVSIAANTSLHYEMVIRAAESGVKAIYCEKPIAESLEDADKMVDVCDRAGVRLVINHIRRWDLYYKKAKLLIDAGEIGELQIIAGYVWTPLLDGGTHLSDIFRFFAGDVDWVFGHIDKLKYLDSEKNQYYEVPDKAVGHLHFKNGVHGLIALCSRFYLDLVGTEGRIRLGNFTYPFELWKGRENQQEQIGFPAVMKHTSGMVNAVQEIIECIEQNKESISSGRDGRAALEIVTAIFESERSGGAVVKLPLKDRKSRIKTLE